MNENDKKTAVNDILDSIKKNGRIVTKELLIYLYHVHQQYYRHGLLTRDKRDLLNTALQMIWADYFGGLMITRLAVDSFNRHAPSVRSS